MSNWLRQSRKGGPFFSISFAISLDFSRSLPVPTSTQRKIPAGHGFLLLQRSYGDP
jgi:hypothetical protein